MVDLVSEVVSATMLDRLSTAEVVSSSQEYQRRLQDAFKLEVQLASASRR